MTAVARALSILGHPLLVLPLAALIAMHRRGDTRPLWPVMLGFASVAALVMAYASWQVRRGRWAHVDASAVAERRALNHFLFPVMLGGAMLAATFASPLLALGLGLSAALVLVAMLSSRACKLSLHVAFAVFAALLLWHVGAWATGLGLVFAAAVAWSRLSLARHVPSDLLAGAVAGVCAGLAFWSLSRLVQA